MGGYLMRKAKLLFIAFLMFFVWNGSAMAGLFSDDEPIQDGLNVIELSEGFADIYSKLDGISWGGKNIDVAIENLEQLNRKAHIASTDERVVLVWGDSIVANYPRPIANDWKAFGEITTALLLKMRKLDANLASANKDELYQVFVEAIMRGIDETGHYVLPKKVGANEDGHILTSVGIEGYRDDRGNFRVTGVYKGSPANTAGVMEGDLIAEINGSLIADLADSALSSMLSGFSSGTLKMTLLTPTGKRRVVVRRATIVLADADIVFLNAGEGSILEIIVNRISDNSVAIIGEALSRHQDLKGIILDLRAATGEDERATAKLAGFFVGSFPIMRIVEGVGDEMEVVPAEEAVTEAPMVVVVSNTTSGMGEALAAAFYESGRALLIGTPTAGNVRMSSRIKLANGGALELMNKTVKTGEGKTLDGRGVFPLVCLSNIKTSNQQNVFFINVINNDFKARDFNQEEKIDVEKIRAGCPVIASGTEEDILSLSVASKILTDDKLYKILKAL